MEQSFTLIEHLKIANPESTFLKWGSHGVLGLAMSNQSCLDATQ